jgi:hypothetical protein
MAGIIEGSGFGVRCGFFAYMDVRIGFLGAWDTLLPGKWRPTPDASCLYMDKRPVVVPPVQAI